MDRELLKFEEKFFSDVNDNITTYIQSLADSQNMISDLKNIATEKNKLISELESIKKANEKKISDLSDELENANEKLKEYEADIQKYRSLKVDAVTLVDLINQNEIKSKELEDQRNEYLELKEKLENDNFELNSKLDRKEKEYQKAMKELDKKEVDRKELEGKLDQKNKDIEKLQDDYNELSDKSIELISSLKDAEEKIDSLNNQLEEKNSDYASYKIDAESRISKLEEEKEWLIGYAKGTDEKILNYKRGNKSDLEGHANWLMNEIKDDSFTRFFGNKLNNCNETVTNNISTVKHTENLKADTSERKYEAEIL